MATLLDQNRIKVSNYLVPAVGGCSSAHIRYAGEYPDADNAFSVDFRIFALDGEVFSPSGFFATNHSATESVFIQINNGLAYEIPPGFSIGRQYPAPFDQSAKIYGSGDADIVFVNFPVIPFRDGPATSGDAVSIANGADVALGATTDSAQYDASANATLLALAKGILGNAVQFDSTGLPLPYNFDSLPQTLTYNTAGDVSTIAITNGANTWTQTLTYTSGNLTGVSSWVKT